MPELPEVETVVRTLRPHIENREILSMEETQPCLVPESLPCTVVQGFRVREVFRRGKFIVCRLARAGEEDILWVTHLRMTGSLRAWEGELREGAAAQPGRYTRCIVHLGADGQEECCVLFNDVRTFGRIFLGRQRELDAWSSWKKLGPEPLTMGDAAFAAAVKGKRAIKSVIMDQRVLAGIGNIYADESLFAAGILPMRAADSLSVREKKHLYAELVRLLNLSIEECGSSIRNYYDANGNAGAFQNHFLVYGRGGSPCQHCQSTLQKVTLNGRGTVFCPVCQR